MLLMTLPPEAGVSGLSLAPPGTEDIFPASAPNTCAVGIFDRGNR